MVKLLFDGRLGAGAHSITISADDLPSGVYLLRLNAGRRARCRKMVLMR